MSDSSIRVTDKRLFTSDGELREEYRFLEDRPSAGPPEPVPSAPPPEPPRPLAEVSSPSSDGQGPGFFDLLAMIAEPASVYLGDLPLEGGQSAEDLEMARLHIELLAMLKQKTAGNLSSEESAVLDDTLYRLQMRYVEKRS